MIFIMLIFSLIVTNSVAIAALNLGEGDTALICNASGDQTYLSISGDKIVWQDNRYGDWDIFMYDISTGEEKEICNVSGDQVRPRISGDIIVWADGRNSEPLVSSTEEDDWDIWMYNLTTKESQAVKNTDVFQFNPAVSGNTIAWQDYSDYYDEEENINLWIKEIGSSYNKLAEGENTQITPSFDSGDSSKMVWCEITPERSITIVTLFSTRYRHEDSMYLIKYKNNNNIKTIHSSHDKAYTPAISGGNIVWMEGQSGTYDIWMLNTSTGQKDEICPYNGDQRYPVIDQNKVVWLDLTNNGIYMYDSASVKKIASTEPIDSSVLSETEKGKPVISNNYVVWSDKNSTTGNWDVWLHRVDSSKPSLSVRYPEPEQILLNESLVTVNGTVSDSNLRTITVNGIEATITGNEWSADINLIEGDNTISVVAFDAFANENRTDFTVHFYKYGDCYLLSPSEDFIENGGNYSRLYKTKYFNSKVWISSDDQNNFTHTNTDEAGIFAIIVDSSDVEAGSNKKITLNELMIENNGMNKTFDDLSMFNFTLSVLPRNYSTTWYVGTSMEAGGGPMVYVKGEKARDFSMTVFNRDTNLTLQRSQELGATLGAKAGVGSIKNPFSKDSDEKIGLVNADLHGSCSVTSGSQVTLDYVNAPDAKKCEAINYITTSACPSSTLLMLANWINSGSELQYDYSEAGTALSAGAGLSLIDLGNLTSIAVTDDMDLEVADTEIGANGELGKFLSFREYPADRYKEYRYQSWYNLKGGVAAKILGTDIIDWTKSLESQDCMAILGEDKNNVLTANVNLKGTKPVSSNQFITQEVPMIWEKFRTIPSLKIIHSKVISSQIPFHLLHFHTYWPRITTTMLKLKRRNVFVMKQGSRSLLILQQVG